VIFYFSLNSGIKLPSGGLPTDKIGHFGAYAVLSFLLLRSLIVKGKTGAGKIALALAGSTLYGVLLEMLQGAFFPHRQFEWEDILANSLGVLVGFIGFRLFTFKS
jgi:VanZ family protein